MSGWFFLAIGLIATMIDFAVGLYLLRRGADRPPLYAEGMALEAEATARVGRLVMFVSPLFLLIFALLAFGLIPVESIDPIALGAGSGG